MILEFEPSFLSGKALLTPGKLRVAPNGFGFKAAASGRIITIGAEDIKRAVVVAGCKGFAVKVTTANGQTHKFDGFSDEQVAELKRSFREWSIDMEQKEVSVRGWNWGQVDFAQGALSFNVGNKPAIEFPYEQVANSTLNGKNEVTVEFKPPTQEELDEAGKDGLRTDQLVEVRFYVPDVSGQDDDGEDQENAASVFQETIKDKAELGVYVGESLAQLEDLPFVTPRGRFVMDLYEGSFRLHGKSNNYKIPYSSILSLFTLPRPDDIHEYVVIGLDPPLRQGQTRYPYLVMMCVKDMDLEVELNTSALDVDLKTKYSDRVKPSYDAAMYLVVSQLLAGLSGVSITKAPTTNPAAMKCAIKANEGYLFLLDQALMFLPKPVNYVKYTDVSHVLFSRVGTDAVGGSRTFDMKLFHKNTAHQQLFFGGLDRGIFQELESHLKGVGIKVRNEISAEEAALKAIGDISSDDDSDGGEIPDITMGGTLMEDEDSEEDADFVADEESDVAEEFDENVESSDAEDEEE